MINRLYTLALFCTLFCAAAIVPQQLYGSHAMGADLQYECINASTNTYKITLRFYRDCSGISAPTSLLVNVQSATCGQSFTATLLQEPCANPNPNGGIPCEVSPLCNSAIGQSTCSGGTFPGVQAFTYSATVQFPAACADWVISFSECCRNAQITNLQNPDSEDLYVEARLNNTGNICNNSPEFTTLPVPFICANQPFSYNHGAVDIDGDSLVYSLVTPLTTGGLPINHVGGFSPTNPMFTTPANTFGFGSSTGQMNFTPNGVQVVVVTVLVEEYRNGVLIGSTMRDIQVVVVNLAGCANPIPTFSNVIQPTVQNGVYVNSTLVQVCPGQVVSFSTLAVEQSGDSVYHTSNVAQAIPGAQYTTAYTKKDSSYGYFTWQPTGLDTGMNTFIVEVKNNSCPLSSSQAFAITVQVLAGTYAGPDVAYCPAGGPVQLQVYGGTAFTWAPTAGLSNPNISNPTASPTSTTQYIVTSNLSNLCKNTDTIVVSVVPDFTYTLSQTEDTICRFEFAQLTAQPEATYAPYQYTWAPAQSLNNAGINNPTAQPDFSTTYVVTIKSNLGCVIKDSLRVIVEGQGPAVKVTADKIKVCPGDTIQLTADVSTMPCGINVVPCVGNYVIKDIGTGSGSTTTGTPYSGFYSDGRIQILYRATELTAQGLQAGTITDIAFDVAQKVSSQPFNNLTVKMGCTNLNFFSGNYVGGLAVVANPTAFSTTIGSNTHTLDFPYDWDGQSNLIVELCFDNNSYTNDDAVTITNTGYNSVLYRIADNTSGCNLTAPTASALRPNTRFIQCIEPPKTITYAWTPTTGLFSPDSLNTKLILNQSTEYFLNVSDGECTGGGSILLNIDTSFTISAGPDVPFCNGSPAQLQATLVGTPPNWLGGGICGINGTPCASGNVTRTYNPTGSFSSSVTIFDGAFFGALEDQRSQMLYLASDLQAAGFTAGAISHIGFNIPAKSTVFPFNNLSVKIACTNKTALTNTWEPAQLVYTNATYLTVAGWNDLPLTTAYDWDGQSNLIVELCWDNPDNFPSSGADPITAITRNYDCFHTTTGTLTVGCNLSTAGNLFQILPAMRLRMCASATVPITYVWQPSTGLSATNIGNPLASPPAATTYTVTAYFGGTCPKVDSVTVIPQTFPYTLAPDTFICEGQSVLLSVTGGNQYVWAPATGLSCTNCPNPTAGPTATTNYIVQITDTTTGCKVTDTVLVDIVNLNITALWADTLIDQGTPIQLFTITTGGNGNYTYVWSPAQYLDNATAANPVSTPITNVLYTVTVSNGPCTDTASVNVRVNIIESPIKMPNAFSPNGDGKNDGFYPVSFNGIATVKSFRIYNRYGQLIHDSNQPWDGKFKGAEQPAGTYLYYVIISRPFQQDENVQGSFTLLR